jgi:hypothetical protein
MKTTSSNRIIGNGASVQKKYGREGEACLGIRSPHVIFVSILVTKKPNNVRIPIGETEAKAKIMQYPCQEDEEKLKIIATP